MKLPNGYGSVHKLPGKRRNPYRARKTAGWKIVNGKTVQQYITIGYYATRSDALTALAQYNTNPYDIDTKSITFAEVYEKWYEEYSQKVTPGAIRSVRSSFNHSEPLHKMRMIDIRVIHLEKTIEKADCGIVTKQKMKSLYNLIFRYALKHEIVEKDYAALCSSVKRETVSDIHSSFTVEEIKILWDNIDFPFMDMVITGIYTGFRPQELCVLKLADVDLANQTIIGGLKTDAGRNRIVPIHPDIKEIIERNVVRSNELGGENLFTDFLSKTDKNMNYNKYRNRWRNIMTICQMQHRMHDTRHTFITYAKKSQMNEYILKQLIGHVVRDITESVYTHRSIEEYKKEMYKLKFE